MAPGMTPQMQKALMMMMTGAAMGNKGSHAVKNKKWISESAQGEERQKKVVD